MLMHAHDGAVDHLDFAVVSLRDRLQNLVPDTGSPPAHEAIVAGRVRAITFGNIGPRCAAAEPPEDAVQDAAGIGARHAARFVGQKWCDDVPLGVGEFVACHLKLPRLVA